MPSYAISNGQRQVYNQNGALDIRMSSLHDLYHQHHQLDSLPSSPTIEYSLELSTPHGSTTGSQTIMPATIGGDRNTRIYENMTAQEQANCPILGPDMRYHEKLADQMTTILGIADPEVRGSLFTHHVEGIKAKLAEPNISLFLRAALQLLIIDSGTWNLQDSLYRIRTVLKDFEIISKHPLSKAELACVSHMKKVATQFKESYEKMDDGDHIFCGTQNDCSNPSNRSIQVSRGDQVMGGGQANDAIEMEQFPRPMEKVQARVPELCNKKRGCLSILLSCIFPDR